MDATTLSNLTGQLEVFATQSGADGVTLWRADGSDLLAIANPLEPRIIGLRQPIRQGIISQAYLTGQPMLEESPASNPVHDTTIDSLTGKSCAAIMVVPVEFSDGDGVISAVKFQDGMDESRFTLGDLADLSALAEKISGSGRLVK